jgi:hypothetical protein
MSREPSSTSVRIGVSAKFESQQASKRERFAARSSIYFTPV